jgi:hypothetical protein
MTGVKRGGRRSCPKGRRAGCGRHGPRPAERASHAAVGPVDPSAVLILLVGAVESPSGVGLVQQPQGPEHGEDQRCGRGRRAPCRRARASRGLLTRDGAP